MLSWFASTWVEKGSETFRRAGPVDRLGPPMDRLEQPASGPKWPQEWRGCSAHGYCSSLLEKLKKARDGGYDDVLNQPQPHIFLVAVSLFSLFSPIPQPTTPHHFELSVHIAHCQVLLCHWPLFLVSLVCVCGYAAFVSSIAQHCLGL